MPFSHYRCGRKGNDTTPPDLFIATPCNAGRPCCNYVMSLCDSAVYFAEQGVKFDFWLHTEDCHVDDARNFLVKQFMDSGAPYMVFIDDDVGWDTESLAKLLCYQDADIVGGAYPLKQPIEDYPVRIKSAKDSPVMQARPDGLLEVDGIPTGFMRISRKVIEAMMEHRKHLQFFPKDADPLDESNRLTIIFERMMVEGHRWSGDLNFCREARGLGFKIWVDPEMTFTHQGNMRWEGHLGMFLRKKRGILDPRLDAAIDKLIAGDNSLENFVAIGKWYAEPWSMSPKGMKVIYDTCLEAKGPILEVGSGITSILAGIACARNGQTVHSLEHDIDWFRFTRNMIQMWKLKPNALYYAPLKEYPEHMDRKNPNTPLMWYSDLEDIPEKFDVVIIDGPPRRFGRDGIYKLILDRIKDATWILDDMEEKEALALVTEYATELGKKVEVCKPNLRNVHRMRWHAIVR
jgi:hypothetical protein